MIKKNKNITKCSLTSTILVLSSDAAAADCILPLSFLGAQRCIDESSPLLFSCAQDSGYIVSYSLHCTVAISQDPTCVLICFLVLQLPLPYSSWLVL